jgi:NitT/TauT family transport system substrate-binding protein
MFITGPDCTDCGCGPAIAPPLRVTRRPVRRILSRRATLAIAAKASAVSLLLACSPEAARPTNTGSSAGASSSSTPAAPDTPTSALRKIDLAFCSQVLCIVPYEAARQRGFFAAEGLDVNIVYMRGGAQAMNALLSNSIDWIATPMDLVVQAAAQGKNVRMLVSTARLPFFALVSSPKAPDIKDVQHLAGKKIGVAAVGTTDQLLARYLLTKAGLDPDSVEWAVLGPNLYDVLLRGQVEAGMVQEPSLTLLQKAGGKPLVNFMNLKDTQQWLGSAYQFMGLNTRTDVLETQADVGGKLVRALVKANQWVLGSPGSRVVDVAPPEIVSGGDIQTFADAIDTYKVDLFPADGKIAVDAVQRVLDVQLSSGALKQDAGVKAEDLFTNKFVPG